MSGEPELELALELELDGIRGLPLPAAACDPVAAAPVATGRVARLPPPLGADEQAVNSNAVPTSSFNRLSWSIFEPSRARGLLSRAHSTV